MGRLFYAILTAILVVSAMPLYVTIGARFEGDWFPVVDDFEILRIDQTEGGSLVYVQFDKKRDCQYLGIAWFSNRTGILDRRELRLKPRPDDSDNSRPTGDQVSGPWFVAMPADEIRPYSVVTVTHQCSPFYVTRTHLYP